MLQVFNILGEVVAITGKRRIECRDVRHTVERKWYGERDLFLSCAGPPNRWRASRGSFGRLRTQFCCDEEVAAVEVSIGLD